MKTSIKFTVAGNNNYYFATSEKTQKAFCDRNGFTIDQSHTQYPSEQDKKVAEKAGRGVWVIEASTYFTV
jgi:hypothetical protein